MNQIVHAVGVTKQNKKTWNDPAEAIRVKSAIGILSTFAMIVSSL